MNTILGRLQRRLGSVKKRILKMIFDPRAHVLHLIEKGSNCAEIGVWKGAFSQKMLRRRPGKLHLIDPWLYIPEYGDRVYGSRGDNSQEKMDGVFHEVQELFKREPSVVLHRKTSEQAVSEFADGYFHFVYIDGNHSYEFVKKDIEQFLPKVRDGGYIAGDDYIFRRCPNGGPKRAVDEITATGRVDLLSIKNNQFVLRKRSVH